LPIGLGHGSVDGLIDTLSGVLQKYFDLVIKIISYCYVVSYPRTLPTSSILSLDTIDFLNSQILFIFYPNLRYNPTLGTRLEYRF